MGGSSVEGERRAFEQVKEMRVLNHIKALVFFWFVLMCLSGSLVFHSLHFGIIFRRCLLTSVSPAVKQFSVKLYITATSEANNSIRSFFMPRCFGASELEERSKQAI